MITYPNKWVIKTFYAELHITTMKGQSVVSKVDKNIVAELQRTQWYFDGKYIRANTYPKLLHRFILPKKNGYDIDHINQDQE